MATNDPHDRVGELKTIPFRAARSAAPAIERTQSFEQELARERVRREVRRVLDAEERGPAPPPPEIRTLRELLAEADDSEPAWRIDGWLPVGARVVFSAAMKTGKTTMIGALTRSLVDGDAWLGRAAVRPVAGRVAIIDTEMNRGQLRRWFQEQRIQHDERVLIEPLRGNAAAFDILQPEGRARWATRLRERNVDVLVLDCLRPVLDAHGLDEHRDAGRFLVAFDLLLREAGIGEAIVVHHMGARGTVPTAGTRTRTGSMGSPEPLPPAFRLPGITLLQVTDAIDGAVRVRCPGCCAEYVFPRHTDASTFAHNDRGCPVFREIAAALEAFQVGQLEVRA